VFSSLYVGLPRLSLAYRFQNPTAPFLNLDFCQQSVQPRSEEEMQVSLSDNGKRNGVIRSWVS